MISTGKKRVKAFPPDPPSGAKRSYKTYKTQKVNVPRNFVRTGKGFPKKLMFTHAYSETTQIPTGAAGALAVQNWKINGMWDTNTSGGGHQPMYFDQIGALYNYYVVVGAIARVQFVPNAANTVPTLVGCYFNDNTTNPALSGILEQNTSKFKLSAYGGLDPIVFTMKWSAKKYFGRNVIDDSDLRGTPSSDPSEITYLSLFTDASQSVTAAGWTACVTIEFTAIWKELIDIASS